MPYASKSLPVRRKKRKKLKKKIKYRKLGFKLTEGQKGALDAYCRVHRITPVRFIKALINQQVAKYRDNPAPPSFVTPNQLELFQEEEKQGKSMGGE